MSETVLKLSAPGTGWENGSPLGGGSFGALLLGGTDTEKIWLTEETVWSQKEMAPPDPEFREKIEYLKKMYLSGEKYIDEEAQRLLGDSMQCVCSFEYAGILEAILPGEGAVSGYSRELDLANAVFRASFKKGALHVKEEAFCSYPYEVTAVRWRFSEPCEMLVRFTREFIEETRYEEGVLTVTARTASGGHGFAVGVRPVTDGTAEYKNGRLYFAKGFHRLYVRRFLCRHARRDPCGGGGLRGDQGKPYRRFFLSVRPHLAYACGGARAFGAYGG